MNITIRSLDCSNHKALLERHIEKRIPVTFNEGGMNIELALNDKLGKKESYKIEFENNIWKITGTDELGLYYGIGKFLHTAKWSEKDFVPQPPVGVISPACEFRATYYSVHFYNWYYSAPISEMEEYVEEMLLYGYNTIISIVPLVCFDSCDEPAFFQAVEKLRAIFSLCKKLGMNKGIIINPNQGLKTTPQEFNADYSCYENRGGGGGKNICPTVPGAMEYMKYLWVMMLKRFTDIGLDYVLTWPYDEGGCGCENCRPWGAKGYLDLCKETYKEIKRFYPNAKYILSCWYFDEPYNEGEYEGLYKRLKEDMSFVDMLMCDGHQAFPSYPLEHEIIKPIVSFPEISMWGMRPWGGRGATPLLKRFQGIWDSSKKVLSGGMPYSEGSYEDISKVQFAGYFWEPDRHYKDIMAEYISYEYSPEVVEDAILLMELLEESHADGRNKKEPDLEKATRARDLANAIDERLCKRRKEAWRWRILYIRAHVDYHLYHDYYEKWKGKKFPAPAGRKVVENDGTVVVNETMREAVTLLYRTLPFFLEDNSEAQDLLQELCKWYHSEDESKEKDNVHTLPPVKNGKVRKTGDE